MKIKKKIEVKIEINGKLCAFDCPFLRLAAGECGLFEYIELKNNTDRDDRFTWDRCNQCIK